ncbi:Transposase (putative), YhgA-like protein [Candidatus Magnetoovum chiemensis]|nr:Transposase (putative), YhgA-like protein [Candidatus Magnetoovum chiemensis]
MAYEYDKIIKETLNDIVSVLISEVLGINADRITQLKTKMQITDEREADFIFEIEENGKVYLLHIEFQTTNDPNMPIRMLRYWVFMREILERIKNTVKEETLRGRYIKQIEVLSRLRDLQDKFSNDENNKPR